jgi:F0F1-type ATP synthase assembly protein I
MGADPEHGKLDDLSARIRQAEGAPNDLKEETAAPQKFSRVGFDFIGAMLGCGILGWSADRYFNTQPWILIIMIFVGFAVGMVTVWKAMDKK